MSSPRFEFHVSRAARRRYQFDETLFSVTGNVVFADLGASRDFAGRMNAARDAEGHPERTVRPAELHALGLIDEALHLVVALYRDQRDPKVWNDALSWYERRLGRERLDRSLAAFVEEFPPLAVHRGERGAAEWLARSTGGVSHRAVALEELMMLWLANANPAFRPYGELFDDRGLERGTAYREITGAMRAYFDTRPRFGPAHQNLVDLLRAPALASPDSLEGQLAFLRDEWLSLLGDFVTRLLTALDVLKEEQVAVWMRFHPPARAAGGEPPLGPSGADWIPRFQGESEAEAFSADQEWMPRTVLLAKSVWVWLHQLSLQYRREIVRLDQVPDEELDRLARRGFNALWLIGVWERSAASQRIKQLTGNPEAVASAYSLLDYTIAGDLGGEGAYANLRERAAARGIRLASDMVPNHMGIDSRWVIEHPDWFLQLRHTPFPSYRFDGPDLSRDGRVEIKIEDHYYDRSDAAVVFRRVDRHTGDTRFLYHGNDGTSFPWNDTAQLDYLNPQVREAVIQTILAVARRFPILRFDAAMTLAKRHYQRLWFPEPGTGGAIPSRAEHGLSRAELDARMPKEFWREVVDRVAVEAPGTLLLAEAFWLMEGYFVRTLGMHRVYNSAFMNMLRDEENANYRSVIKNTLEFDPDVLKRYVNFMSNPDERTAVDQFGKGDKYFGVCTLMSTLPGLPMFGHGQIEGFTEKYGMEYRRAYQDEPPDSWLVARHEREITPLLHRRALFADAREFLLYDFFADGGGVNEDVFAYSNRTGDERALVVFHNRYGETRGWIRVSCAYSEKHGDGGRTQRQRTLGEGLGVAAEDGLLVAWRDSVTGLESLRRARDVAEQGLRFELSAYQCHVLLDWRLLRDDGARPWSALCDRLGGRAVASLDDAMRALVLEPVHDALGALLDPALVTALAAGAAGDARTAPLLEDARRRLRVLLAETRRVARGALDGGAPQEWRGDAEETARGFEARLEAALRLRDLGRSLTESWPEEARAVIPGAAATATPATAPDAAARAGGDGASIAASPPTPAVVWAPMVTSAAIEALGRLQDPADADRAAVMVFETFRLREAMADAFERIGLAGDERWRAAARVRTTFAHAGWAPGVETPPGRTTGTLAWLHDPDVAWTLGVHDHDGVRYFSKEAYERLLGWMALRPLLALTAGARPDAEALRAIQAQVTARARAAAAAGYRVESLLDSAVVDTSDAAR